MDNPAAPAAALNIEQLLHLHTLTKEVSKYCCKQLRGYLDTMALLFRPRRVLGDAMEGAERESVGGSDRTVTELRELYRRVALDPFDLRRELELPLESVSTQMALYEWEYLHSAKTDAGWRTIKVTSPLTWVVTYTSTYSLSMLRQVMAGKQERDAEGVRSFVLRSCLMHLQFMKLPELKALFEGLRYQVEVRKSPQLGELPLVTVSAPVRTVRPANELLLAATGLSGRTGFEEVIDDDQAARIPDPLQAQILRVLDTGEGRESPG